MKHIIRNGLRRPNGGGLMTAKEKFRMLNIWSEADEFDEEMGNL